ncbi:fungal-specific transcription factor domain-containing protein [Apiospora arundinis]
METGSKKVTKSTCTRSQHGCWTCKLRRKKCDESRPTCQTCESLLITCEGYGPRPTWMDRGPLEKETAEKVKMAVAQSPHRRSRSRWKSAFGAQSPSPSFPKDQASTNAAVRTTSSPTTLAIGIATPPLGQGSQRLSSLPFSDPSPSDCWSWRNLIPPSSDDMPMSNIPSLSSAHSATTEFDLDLSSFLNSNIIGPEQTLVEAASTSLFNTHHILGPTTSGASNGTFAEEPKLPHSSTGQDNGHRVGSEGRRMSSISSVSTRFSSPHPPGSVTERAMLVSYYLSEIAPKHFYFSSGGGGFQAMQWVQFLVLASQPVLEVVMRLSRVYNVSLTSSSEGIVRVSEDDMAELDNLVRAFPSPTASNMPPLDDEQTLRPAIAACTSLVQCIQLEVFCGGSRHWPEFLRAAAPYMQSLIDVAVSGEQRHSSMGGSPLHRIPHLLRTAAKVMLGKLVWFDMLATVSTGKGPFLSIQHSQLLESDTADMVIASGCQNLVVMALGEIVSLKGWKARAENERRLSMIELVTRGVTIIESLNNLVIRLTDATTTEAAATSAQDIHHDNRLTTNPPMSWSRTSRVPSPAPLSYMSISSYPGPIRTPRRYGVRVRN